MPIATPPTPAPQAAACTRTPTGPRSWEVEGVVVAVVARVRQAFAGSARPSASGPMPGTAAGCWGFVEPGRPDKRSLPEQPPRREGLLTARQHRRIFIQPKLRLLRENLGPRDFVGHVGRALFAQAVRLFAEVAGLVALVAQPLQLRVSSRVDCQRQPLERPRRQREAVGFRRL